MTANDCLYLQESVRGTYETINAAVMHKFGIEPLSNEFQLKLPFDTQINTNSTMSSRTATFTKGPQFMEGIQAQYIPVNGLPEFRMLGDSSTATTVHTLTAAAVTTMKPSLTMYRQGQAATEKRKVAGAVNKSLQFRFQPGKPETCQESFDSITDAVTTDAPSASPIFPTNIDTPFDVKSTFTINAAAYEYEEIGWNWNHTIAGYGNNAGKRRGIIDTSPIILTGTFNLKGDVTALRTIQDAGTGVSVVSKIIKSKAPTKYKQYTCTMYIMNMSENFKLDDATDRCVVTMIGSGPSVAVDDGVADAFYGD